MLFGLAPNAGAQGLAITGVMPLANAGGVAPSSALVVSFSQPLTTASADALQVSSSQRGGRRSRGLTPATVVGTTLRFTPSGFNFAPGETVQYTVTSAAASSNGSLARPRVGQFTVATAGLGANTFRVGTHYQSGYVPEAIQAADADGDGDLDLLVANSGSSALTVNLNNGRGTFSMPTVFPIGTSAADVRVGDLDGDGDLDVVVPNNYSNTANVLLNNGQPFGFTNAPDAYVGQAPTSSALGDLDGDGDLDLLVTNALRPGAVSVCHNDGQGHFTRIGTFPVGDYPSGIALADLDGDGDLDCAVANRGSGPGNGVPTSTTVSLVYNTGDGQNFTPGADVTVGMNPLRVVVGDWDGDGDQDLATVNIVDSYYASGFLSIALNSGAGAFAVTTLPLSSEPSGLAAGDMDGDGDVDLVATIGGYVNGSGSYWGTTAQVARNNGSGSFALGQVVPVGSRPTAAVLADFDGDRVLDLAVTNGSGNYVSVCLNRTMLSATAMGNVALFSLTPNPAQGAVFLAGAMPNSSVEVLDLLGRVVLSATADRSGSARLALEGPGVYLVRCSGQVRRVVVE